MTKTTHEMFCDICGRSFNECNMVKGKGNPYPKDHIKMDINFDHQVYVTQNTFYDDDYGKVDISQLHYDICSECFNKLNILLKDPVNKLHPVLPEIPENYYNEKLWEIVEGEEYDNISYNSLKFAGYSPHDCCSYHNCPKCNETVMDGYTDTKDMIKSAYIKRKDRQRGRFVKIFTCPKCGYKCILC